jgi:hypothetical protein
MAAVTSIEIAAEGAKNRDVLDFLKRPAGRLLIGGKWVPAKSGKTFEVENPANEQVIATVAEEATRKTWMKRSKRHARRSKRVRGRA